MTLLDWHRNTVVGKVTFPLLVLFSLARLSSFGFKRGVCAALLDVCYEERALAY